MELIIFWLLCACAAWVVGGVKGLLLGLLFGPLGWLVTLIRIAQGESS